MAPKPRTFVYVDGFNLYYGSLKGTPYRWLDIHGLLQRLLPAADLAKIWYFTAEPRPDPSNPGVAARHREYMRALGTIPILEVKPGFYQLKHSDRRLVFPLYGPDPKLPNPANHVVRIWKSEEKGSDVNLATALLVDAAAHRFDQAWVVSNDADLAWPIEVAQREYSAPIGVIKPERPAGYPNPPRPDSWHLKQAAAEFRKIREPQLAACQFPPSLVDASGVAITKPTRW